MMGREVEDLPREAQIALAELAVEILRDADPPGTFSARNRVFVGIGKIERGREMLDRFEIPWEEEAKRQKIERDEAHRQAQIEEWGRDGQNA